MADDFEEWLRQNNPLPFGSPEDIERGAAKGRTYHQDPKFTPEPGEARGVGAPPVPEGRGLDVANWWRQQVGLEPVPGPDFAEPESNIKGGPLASSTPPGEAKGLLGAPVSDEEADRLRNEYRVSRGLEPLPPGMGQRHSLEPGAESRLDEPPDSRLSITSPAAGPEGFETDARPNPNVMVPPSGWRSLPEHLNATLASLIHSPLSPQQKLEGVQSLLAQQLQGAQQGQNEAMRAWQSVAPRPIGPAETAHYTRAAEAQIAQVPRPQQFTRQSLQQYQIATRKRQEQVQAQVNHWSQIEMKTRMATSQQAFQGLMADRREKAKMDIQEQMNIRQEKRLDKRETDREDRQAIREKEQAAKLAQDAERQQEKEFNAAVREHKERTQQQLIASYQRHLRQVQKEEDEKRKAWDKKNPNEPVSPAPHEALAAEARRRVQLESRAFPLPPRPGSKEWQQDQEGGTPAQPEAQPPPPAGGGAAAVEQSRKWLADWLKKNVTGQ